MNREIKFRAYCKEDKMMYYDIQKGIEFTDLSHYEFDEFLGNPRGMGDYHKWEIMQFTGLSDKNGKDVYEEDILEWKHYKLRIKWGEVGWVLFGDLFKNNRGSKEECNEFNTLSYVVNSKIVGNIYEDKNLL